MEKNVVLVSVGIVYKERGDSVRWFIVKQADGNSWEFPKVVVRKGESSVRGILRVMGEKAGLTTRILEEIGRWGGVATVNGKTMPQRYIYYLMVAKSAGQETLGFAESEWAEFGKASKKLESKKEKSILLDAKKLYSKLKKPKKSAK